jgi:hypothetical protein
MFVNLSISPFLILLFNRYIQHTAPPHLLSNINLTILLLGLGNCFKSLLPIISI